MKLLLTGATGKVGQAFLRQFLSDEKFAAWRVVALVHNRGVETSDRVDTVSGSLADAATIARAMDGVTHVLHMAAVKESPELAIDVSVKGMFLLLEACAAVRDARAVRPDRRRLLGRAHLPRLSRADHRGFAAPRLSGLLRADQGDRGGDAGAVPDPVRAQWLHPARALDHGKGRFPLRAVFRRGPVRRTALGEPDVGGRGARARTRAARCR